MAAAVPAMSPRVFPAGGAAQDLSERLAARSRLTCPSEWVTGVLLCAAGLWAGGSAAGADGAEEQQPASSVIVRRDMKLHSVLLGWTELLTKSCVSPQVLSDNTSRRAPVSTVAVTAALLCVAVGATNPACPPYWHLVEVMDERTLKQATLCLTLRPPLPPPPGWPV